MRGVSDDCRALLAHSHCVDWSDDTLRFAGCRCIQSEMVDLSVRITPRTGPASARHSGADAGESRRARGEPVTTQMRFSRRRDGEIDGALLLRPPSHCGARKTLGPVSDDYAESNVRP